MNDTGFYFLFLQSIFLCYLPLAVLFIILKILRKEAWRQEATNLLAATNFTAGLVLVLSSLTCFYALFDHWDGGKDHPSFIYSAGLKPFTEEWTIYYGIGLILGFVLLAGRFRHSILLSILVIILVYFDPIQDNINRFRRDYHPFSPGVYQDHYYEGWFYKILIFLFTAFISYLFLYLLKKLPYDSRWLKRANPQKDVY